ncbi:MAG: O-antigen ligase family protein [Sulfurimonas sp.]|nr:O-antigen ligase family protein [Sulfurimonas sp.]
MSILVNVSFGGMSLGEITSVVFSYIFIMIAVTKYNKIRMDSISILILFFCFYLLIAGSWGGGFKEIARLILPFSAFFVARIATNSEKQVKTIYLCLVISFIVPVIASTITTLRGQGIEMVVFQTGLARYMGVFTGPHAIAHSMFICLLALVLYDHFRAWEGNRSFVITISLAVLGVLAIFNLYKSYTRNVYIGFAAFLFFYLWGRRKYKLVGLTSVVLLGVVLFSSSFRDIFFDVYDPLEGKTQNVNEMGSGRIGGWGSMLSSFHNAPIVDQIRGLGISAQTTITSGAYFGGAHNDFLSIILCFGYLGMVIYLSLYLTLIIKVMIADTDRSYKTIIIGFIVAVSMMNLLSNSYLTRFELAQYFNMSLGMFFGLSDRNKIRNSELLLEA